jgi:hypothetical protein
MSRGYRAEDHARHRHIELGRRYYLPHWFAMVASGYIMGFGSDTDESPGYDGVYADPVWPGGELPRVMPEALGSRDPAMRREWRDNGAERAREERRKSLRVREEAATEARIEPPAKKAAVAVLKYADVVKLVQKAEIEAMVIALKTTNTNPYLHHLANTSEQQAYKAAVRLGLLSEHGPGWSRITDKGWAMLGSA